MGGGGYSTWWKDVCISIREAWVPSVAYSVIKVYKGIICNLSSLSDPSWSKAWHKAFLAKVSCLVWWIFQNRIASKDNLAKRGVLGPEMLLYEGGCGSEESVSHLFFECPIFTGLLYSMCNCIRIKRHLK